jgi:hypothetical protein
MKRLALLLAALLWAGCAQAQVSLPFPGPGKAGSGGGGGGSLVLDGLTTGVKACFSTRKLLTAYAGSAIRVERATTGQTDIGFASDVLDTAALGTYCSGTTCKVMTWYDQCGAGFNHTVPTFASAPIIYQTGAVTTLNSKPALLSVKATPTYLTNATMMATPTNTMWQSAAVRWDSGAGDNAITGSTLDQSWEWRFSGGNVQLMKSASALVGASTSSPASGTAALLEVQYNQASGLWSHWTNRTAAGTGTNVYAMTAYPSMFFCGIGVGNECFNGAVGEIIIYDLVGGIPGASQTSITLNQKTYWGTP